MNTKITTNYVASIIDHTLLKANATKNDIIKLCEEAKEYDFAAVCVNPYYVSLAKKNLEKTKIKVATVIGFPLGCTTKTVKVIETRDAIANGADEIDMVINISALKSGDEMYVLDEIKTIREASYGKILKVIIETAYLTREEKIKACKIAKDAKIDFVKTSTGFAPSGATIEDVKLMKSVVGNKIGVKASGGIKDLKTAIDMIKAGATRIGTSSGVSIIKGDKSENQY